MKKIKIAIGISFVAFFFCIGFVACKKEKTNPTQASLQEPVLPQVPYDYLSKHLVNNDLATLGRVLFYDKNLSTNSAISCGSCHKQQFAFADNVKVNKGFNGINLKRNSPALQGIRGFFDPEKFSIINGNWVGTVSNGMPTAENQQQVLLFWDGRQKSVSDMVLNPVLNHNEMNMPGFDVLIAKLKSTTYYPGLFKNAFNDETITKEKIAYDLEGFLTCLNTSVSINPTQNTQQGNFEPNGNFFNDSTGVMPSSFTSLEQEGKFLFHTKYNCARCHDPSNTGVYGTVTNPSLMFNIGLDEVYADNGLGAITGKPGDQGLFKVPSLKNISVTAPYMHDGRFANLGEVLDHYSHNIKSNKNLAPLFKELDGTPKKLNILPAEKLALIAFLNTLKDDDFLTSDMYADPFKK